MSARLLKISDDFWNIRGSFKVGGVVDIGTHASLVRRASGKFVLLDAYTLDGDAQRELDELTDGGSAIEAILNLHPFHTVHVRRVHERYPDARLFGTARHRTLFPELPWEDLVTEDSRLHEMFAGEFEFSVPAGVDFISSNEHIHFSSVLVMHRDSRTIHSDDTYMVYRLPGPVRKLGLDDRLSFHPTLARALEKRPGAAEEFRRWATQLNERWGDAQTLCAAHLAVLQAGEGDGGSLRERMVKALQKVDRTLQRHSNKYG